MDEEQEHAEYAFWQAVKEALTIQESYPQQCQIWRDANEFLKGYDQCKS